MGNCREHPIDFGEEPAGATTTALEQKYSKQMRQIVSRFMRFRAMDSNMRYNF